jgi:hypothetical protein
MVRRYLMQIIHSAQPKVKRPRALGIAFALWLSLTSAGVAGLWLYSSSPGNEGNPPDVWPAGSSLRREPGTSTLVMFLHPQCPCSRASIYELAVLLAHSAGNLHPEVVFLKAPGKEDSWTHGELWHDAAELPGTVVTSDLAGREAALFQVTTSGETVVYDAAGNLRFHGGMTGARGHIGDNTGCSAVESYANAGVTSTTRTRVFGCPLFHEPTSKTP